MQINADNVDMSRNKSQVPEGWVDTTVGRIAKVVGGGTPSTTDARFWDGNIPWATPTDITKLDSRYISDTVTKITEEGLKNSGAVLLPARSVLMTSRATIGACAINTVPMATNQGFASIICNDGVEPEFIYYLFSLRTNEIRRLASGSTFVELAKKEVRKLKVLHPPINEQKKVVVILNSIDSAIARTREVIGQTRRVKESLLQELFTKGLPGRHKKFKKIKGLGHIPIEWEHERLGKLCILAIDGPFGSNLKTCHYSTAGVRVLRLQNIGIGEFQDTDKAFVPVSHFEGLRKYEAVCGDILVASMGDDRNPAGRCCTVPQHVGLAMIKADCFRLRLKRNIADPLFIKWYMNSDIARGVIERGSHGQTRTRLNLANMRRVIVPIPQIDEQEVIGKTIEIIHEREKAEHRKLSQILSIKVALTVQLLTGKIRVEI